MTKPDAGTARIAEAAAWLAVTPRRQRGPAIPELRHRYGLTAAEAVVAVREAVLIQGRAQ